MNECSFLESQVNAGSSSIAGVGEHVPQWASWAFSALSSKFYKTPAAAPATTASAAASPNAPAPSSATGVSPARQSPAMEERKVTPAPAIVDDDRSENAWGEDDADWGQMEESTATTQTQKSTAVAASSDGWEEDEPWEGIEDAFVSLF